MVQSPPSPYGLALVLGLIAAAVAYVLRYDGGDAGIPAQRQDRSSTERADGGVPYEEGDASAP